MSKTNPLPRDATLSSERFVYVTYIATTAERVWQALITGDLNKHYWAGYELVSDWREGSAWEMRANDPARTVKTLGKVIEILPPHRLVLTWADAGKADDLTQHSRVTFEVESSDKAVRLTVTHDEFAIGSDMPGRIGGGWPRVLSSMKSFIETGTALDFWSGSFSCGLKK